MIVRNSQLGVVSLFSGAGGLDYGIEAAGFTNVAAVEMDHDCCETLRQNRPTWTVFEKSICDVKSRDILNAANSKPGGIALLIGGPPCQPFSKSGYWNQGDTKRLNDPRAQTLEEYMRVVEDIQPQAILLENVAGLSFTGKDEGIKYLLNRIEEINKKKGSKYNPSCKILRMAEYGVPQIRERFFLIADRDGHSFRYPCPTHKLPEEEKNSQQALFHDLEPAMTAWDAIGELDAPEEKFLAVRGKWGDLLPSIPEGENYLWHTSRKGGKPLFGWRTRYWGFLLKLAKNKPSWTIQAQPGSAIGPFHWKNRKLSQAELLRLMTFPPVTIYGGRTSLQRQLGNAVPSLMAEILGREIARQFFGMSLSGKPSLMPKRAQSIPKSERVAHVPQKYLHLEGDHKPHPGTGKGPMAQIMAKKKKQEVSST